MKLAYFSPLGPQRSGIADYSEELLPHLANGADITLFIDGFQPSHRELISQFEVCDYQKNPSILTQLASFDAVLYHLGNDHRYHAGIVDAMRQHSGVVVFHDFALLDFFLGLARARHDMRIYLDEVAGCHGDAARREAAETLARGSSPAMAARPVEFPLNQRLARGAEGIIVHSEWSRTRLERIAPGVPVRVVPHHITPQAATTTRSTGRSGHGPVRIASFGLITPDKGIERALSVLAALRDHCDFRYALVGEPNSYFDVRALVRRYGLEDRVEITGHVTLDEFERRISETDIVLNLRERTIGETSGSLCRVMAAGVAAIVSNAGWFSELPADAVVKVDHDDHSGKLLRAYLERLIEDAELRERIGANARRHVLANHNIEHSARGYLSFLDEVISERPRRRLLKGVSAELATLGLGPDRDAALLHGVAIEVAQLAPARWFASASGAPSGRSEAGNGNGGSLFRPPTSDALMAESKTTATPIDHETGRLRIGGVDYKRAAIEYLGKLSEERRHHLRTKPFYNLANKPDRYKGEGMDEDTHRHFCDFANIARKLALPSESRILDVGCGSGWLSEYFARLGYVVKGIDISPDLIEMSRERIERVPYEVDHETPLRCTFDVHDIESSALPEKFDAIICYDSLHHFEDERAVMRHLAAMLEVGGMLFVLEGGRPPSGSAGEEELQAVMREFRTLESPFDYNYLCALLDEHGFAVVGDYVGVNGLFEREVIEDARLPLGTVTTNYHYLACKKVADDARASSIPNSGRPGLLRAGISSSQSTVDVAPGQALELDLEIENQGDTLWLVGSAERAGSVMLAIRLFDDSGMLVMERHGTPPLPQALAPGEKVRLRVELVVPRAPGLYMLKCDMVAQHVCWFEERGSTPLILSFRVL